MLILNLGSREPVLHVRLVCFVFAGSLQNVNSVITHLSSHRITSYISFRFFLLGRSVMISLEIRLVRDPNGLDIAAILSHVCCRLLHNPRFTTRSCCLALLQLLRCEGIERPIPDSPALFASGESENHHVLILEDGRLSADALVAIVQDGSAAIRMPSLLCNPQHSGSCNRPEHCLVARPQFCPHTIRTTVLLELLQRTAASPAHKAFAARRAQDPGEVPAAEEPEAFL
mmetsp:Transcript_149641/g.480414  ORF Transcript_149641/g.480414 Transcript_149641/m.480414 type:complete len:229 (-) Transcript_149641:9-695(-)